MPMSLIIEHALSSSSRHGTQHASTMSGGDPHIRLKHPLPAVLVDLASWRKIQSIALQCHLQDTARHVSLYKLTESNLFSSISTWHSLPVTSSGVLINATGENGSQAS